MGEKIHRATVADTTPAVAQGDVASTWGRA